MYARDGEGREHVPSQGRRSLTTQHANVYKYVGGRAYEAAAKQ